MLADSRVAAPPCRDRWVVNTVGYYNRKFFVLFLFYTFLACCWVILTSLPLLLDLQRPGAMRMMERRIGSHKCEPRARAPDLHVACASRAAARAWRATPQAP